jgi:hypothetical protein
MGRWVIALLSTALLLPSMNLQTFDGLPFSSIPEFVALVFLVPFVASRALRRLFARFLGRLGPGGARGLCVLLLLALGLKLVLFLSGSYTGFLACYQTPLGRPSGGASCEHSFENPFARRGVTRIDRHIDFQPETWNLSFVNSLRFDFYPWVPGLPRRDRLPLIASWRGVVARADPWVARLTYVGEVAVTLGRDTFTLPTQYRSPGTAEIPVPAGRHEIVVAYRFDDGSRTGQPPPPFPYAILRLGSARDHRSRPVEAERPHGAWRAIAATGDGLLGLVLLTVLVFYARLLAPSWWLLGLAGGGVIILRSATAPGWLPRGWLYLPFVASLTAAAVARPRPRILLASYVAVVALSIAVALRSVRSVGTVLYRSAGDDYLTYESRARAILETWSLRGGEDVFYNVPLFRYVRFTQRLLLGDGDLLVFAAGLTALYFATVWMASRLRARRTGALGVAGIMLAALQILTLITSPYLVSPVLAPLSEPATWIALLGMFPLLFAARTPRAWPVGAALCGLATGIRPNQAPALAFLVVVFLSAALKRRRRTAIAAAGLFLATAALPLAHNLYYGGRFVLFTTTGKVPDTLVLPPGRLLYLSHDAAVGATLQAQLRGLLGILPSSDLALPIAMHGAQAAWLLAATIVAARWHRLDRSTRLLLLWPALFLGVHLFYDVSNYYPRHVVAGYLAMGLVAAYVASGRGERGAPASAPQVRDGVRPRPAEGDGGGPAIGEREVSA